MGRKQGMEKAYLIDKRQGQSILRRCSGKKDEYKAYFVDVVETRARRKHTLYCRCGGK